MPTIDRYVTPLKVPMPIDTFWRFPHLPAYKAEYKAGQVELTYRPRLSMARLRIEAKQPRLLTGIVIRPLAIKREIEELKKLFVSAFAKVAPLDSMPPTTRRHAADAAMTHTTAGGDGELFAPACFAAADAGDGELVGAAIVCRIGLRADEWPDAPVPDNLVNLTWLFVSPQRQRSQIGSALLDHVSAALAKHQTPWLVSHFADDNGPAMLFHWRHGFELVSWMRRAGGTA